MLGDSAGGMQRAGTGNFMVRILFRQNANCQGEISWVEGGKKRYFRSFLEMIMLMQGALDENGARGNGFRSWDEDEGSVGGAG